MTKFKDISLKGEGVLYVLNSWKSSLQVFLPSNFKLFFLVTLKNILQTYKNLAYYFGWLLIVTAILDYAYARCFTQAHIACLAPLLLWFLVFFVTYLTVRPSVKPKGWDYYTDYVWYFIPFLLLSFIGNIFAALVIEIGSSALYVAAAVSHVSGPFSWLVQGLIYLLIVPFLLGTILILFLVSPDHMVIYVSPLITFHILFLLDAKLGMRNFFKSFVRALRMIFYNYPFCFIMFVTFLLAAVALRTLAFAIIGTHSLLGAPIIPVLLLPIPLCFLNSFYIKRVHEQFTVYFPETVKE